MITETFRDITYSNPDSFTRSGGAITLTEYRDDIISVLNFNDGFDINYGIGVAEETIVSGSPSIENFGAFSSSKKLVCNGLIKWHETNFREFDYGTVRFKIKPNFITAVGRQAFTSTIASANTGEYKFIASVNDIDFDISVNVFNTDTIEDISVRLSIALDPFDITSTVTDNKIYLATTIPGTDLEIKEPTSGNSLITFLGGTETPTYINNPTENVEFFSMKVSESNNSNRISLIHDTDSNLVLNLYDGAGTLALTNTMGMWSNYADTWYELELNLGEKIGQFFIDGILFDFFPTNIERESLRNYLYLYGTSDNNYSFDEIIFFNEYKHTNNYAISTEPLLPYDTSAPYIDINFEGIATYENKALVSSETNNLYACYKNGGSYYYYNGGWVPSAGNFSTSSDLSTFIQNFPDITINSSEDFIIRIFFDSDGLSTVTLNEIYINVGEESTDDEGSILNYTEIFRYVKSRLGAPSVPVELTDEQLTDCLSSAIYHYNKWRNFNEKVQYFKLETTDRSAGFEIPAGISADDIIEIIFKPKYEFAYYAGRSDLVADIYVQKLFEYHNLSATAADYAITIMAENDLANIFGSKFSWEIINNRLFIYPVVHDYVEVAIRYKAALTVDEIINSQTIKDLLLAEAKITLGNIRSTFGDQIPGGDGMIQLNGAILKQEGQAEKQSIIQSIKSQSAVYEFIVT